MTVRIVIAGATSVLLTLLIWAVFAGEQTPTIPSVLPDPNEATIVIGKGRTSGPRPVESAFFTYPETAVAADGAIYVANTRGATVEAIRGGTVETIYEGGAGAIFNDITLANDRLAILDRNNAEIHWLTFDGRPLSSMPIPQRFRGDASIFSPSSLDVRAGRYLVAGFRGERGPNGGLYGTDGSLLIEFDGSQWSEIIRSEDVVGKRALLRDASYNSDGSISVLVGEHFAVVGRNDEIRRVHTGQIHGGGILEVEDGWLVGAHTSIMYVDREFDATPRRMPIEFANVGDIRRGSKNALIITDTDRQVVYRVRGDEVETFGGDAALKVVDMDATPDGRLALIESTSSRVVAYEPDTGKLQKLAGSGKVNRSYSAGTAENYSFYYPSGIAVASDGSIFVTEANYRVVRIKDGEVEFFAGAVDAGMPEEGQKRTAARFGALRGLDVDNDGRLLVVDRGNHTVWRIGADDTLERVMGTGKLGMWTEGEAADNQPLNSPMDVLTRRNGSILISDSYNNAIVEVDPDGIVRRFAGVPKTIRYQGFGAYGGDGGPALDAQFNTPWRLAEGPDGAVFIVDQFNNAVRRVGLDGTIETVVGGALGYSDDGSRMNLPAAAEVMDGFLYVADTGNSIVRAVPLNY